jgi:hypothetical protein
VYSYVCNVSAVPRPGYVSVQNPSVVNRNMNLNLNFMFKRSNEPCAVKAGPLIETSWNLRYWPFCDVVIEQDLTKALGKS